MTNAELEEVICGLHRRIALTTAGTPLQDDLIKSVGALRIAVNRIAELEAQMPKEGEWVPVTNGRGGHECNLCHGYAPSYKNGDEHLSKYCPYCGARLRGEQE